MNKLIKQYKEVKAALYLELFNSSIRHILPENCVIYWGMGVCGIDFEREQYYTPESEQELLSAIEKEIKALFEEIGQRTDQSWNNTISYQFFCDLDFATNRGTKEHTYSCDKIEVWKL